jgi:hypothetical protein
LGAGVQFSGSAWERRLKRSYGGKGNGCSGDETRAKGGVGGGDAAME